MVYSGWAIFIGLQYAYNPLEILENISSLPDIFINLSIEIFSTITAFFSGYFLAILIQRRNDKKNFKNMIKSLIMELKYIINILPENKPIVDFRTKNSAKFGIYIAFIDVPILDVIVNTGGYQEFGLEIQKNLSNLSGTTMQSNKLMEELIHIRYTSTTNLSRSEIEDFGREIEKHHNQIRNIIKSLLFQLETQK